MDCNSMSIADWRKIYKFKYVRGPKVRETYAAISGYRDTSDTVEIPERIGNAIVIEISENAFKDNKYVKRIILPKTIIRIYESAFENCKKLQDIVMGDQIEEIRWDAFKNCTALKMISIPPKVKEIGSRTFKNCKNLEKVEFAQNIDRTYGGFEGCYKLADSNGLIIINDCVFGYVGQEEKVVIPEGIKRILSLRGGSDPRNENDIFTGIREIVLPSSVQVIDKYAFEPHDISHDEYVDIIENETSRTILYRDPYEEYKRLRMERGMNG